MAELKMTLGLDTAEKAAQTEYLAKTYKINLVINDFENVSSSAGSIYRSQHVFADTNFEYNYLEINMYKNVTSDYIGVFTSLANANLYRDKRFVLEFSILDGNGKKSSVKLVLLSDGEARIKQFVSRTELLAFKSSLLLKNQLRLECQIFDLSSNENSDVTMNHFKNLLLEGFDRLLGNEKFSDFKLAVKEKEFNVHRAILAAQSPVFEAMFESNMRETSEKKVVIKDIEPKVVEKMLRFIYTGEIDFGNLDVKQVLITAEKYQLDSLKLRCENELAKELDLGNVYDILLFADQNNAAHLTKKAIMFFDKNVKKLVASEDFKTCVSSLPPDLRTEIIYISALNR